MRRFRKDQAGRCNDLNPIQQIGIVTTLPGEFRAMLNFIDGPEPLELRGDDRGSYASGTIPDSRGGYHSVVVLLLPDMGTNSAAIGATHLLERFPEVKEIILMGIAGGVPDPTRPAEHVALGDVVVSDRDGVVQYDYGKQTEELGMIPRHPPRPPSARLLEAVRSLEAGKGADEHPWRTNLQRGLLAADVKRPSPRTDPYSSELEGNIDSDRPRVHLGTIASANVVLKNSMMRDEISRRFSVKAFEMEGSGIADATWWSGRAGYFVIRGVCDYCDACKNDIWQEYAAMVAAAYTRAVLESIPERASVLHWPFFLPKTVAMVALLAAIGGLFFLSERTSAPVAREHFEPATQGECCEAYIQSEVLPLKVYLNGAYVTTLTTRVPATTLQLPKGEHDIVGRWGEFRYSKRIRTTTEVNPYLVWISN